LPATIRYTRSPSVFSDSSLSPSFLRTTARQTLEIPQQPLDVVEFELRAEQSYLSDRWMLRSWS
jgi:hypothetical protein